MHDDYNLGEQALESQIKFALEATNSVVWTIDLSTGNNEIEFGAVESLFGVEIGVMDDMETFIETAVHPEDRPAVEDEFRKVTSGKTDRFHIEFRINPDHQEEQWVQAQAEIQTTDDATRILTGISTDITERKRREHELAEANERLEEFASILSHDLRNPLRVATGQLALLQEECDDTDERIETTDQALKRMETLIDDLQTSIRKDGPLMRAESATEEMETFELAAVAKEAWRNIAESCATLDVETDLVLQGNRTRIQQLFENLFRNTIEHGGDDVTITVDDLDREPGFYVADDGPGFDGVDTDRVFEVGYSTADAGTGMGLHIVRGIAIAHDWQVTATESQKEGARFEFADLEPVTTTR